ncbi:hypothetical protein [Aquiflexum gelatinilyticum]|uniref:Uncharacterized protein n=1 Tax=Aquiflexum gelatinilyticum TaxID=2961943 RepID=A0A9X2P2R8_9BACT|nr:hypothetical protein [Aquiflexum gelatinilyticum]MCR9013411.1 hypothetical protein [Aquiflexum gelatinilyticum]
MRKIYFYLPILLLFSIFQNSYGQRKLNLELYGGPQKSFNKAIEFPQNSDLKVSTPLDYHVGANLLYRIKGPWQLSLQAEALRNSRMTTWYPNFPDANPQIKGRSSELLGNYSIGARYNWEKEKYALFAQPSVGFTVNNYSEMILNDSNYFVGYSPKQTAIVGNVRLEGGIKLYTPRKNYVVFGARFQQSIGQLNTNGFYNPSTNLRIEDKRRGSYAGLFMGYGINFGNKASREQFRSNRPDRKDEKRDLAWKSGPYVMVSGFLRFRPKSEREPNLEFSHISGGSIFAAGYRFNALSVETGYSRFNTFTNISVAGTNVNSNLANNFLVTAIPLTFKYDFQVGDKNRLRFGPTFSAFYTLGTNGERLREGGYGGTGPDGEFDLTYNTNPSDPKGAIFFNAGIFAEVPIFNSSLLNFKVSQNFGSPDVGLLDVTGEVNGQPVNFESSGTLNGFMLELGYKLPLNVLFKK